MSNKALLIKGGRIIDPAQNIDKICDIRIENGTVTERGENLDSANTEIIDASGMLVMPGLIDMHTHLREPGYEESETIISGCEAAAAGGFTAVCPMPNTKPATDDAGRIRYILDAAANAKARVYPVGAMTRGRKGVELTEMGDMAKEGAVAFSDDGSGITDTRIMLNVLRYASMLGKPIIAHEEDMFLADGGHMNESVLSADLGLKGIPRLAEDLPIMRDIALAEYTGTSLHVTHISTRGAVEVIRAAKSRGVKVTCDVTPHHLTQTEDLVATFDTRYKMNPPLREADDMLALREGLTDSTIDAIATDHAPHSPEIKEVEFIYSTFGVTGLETALSVLHRELVDTGIINWNCIVEKLSQKPAELLDVPGGTLAVGSIGDVTIYNPDSKWTVDPLKMKSKSINTSYFDWELPGRVVATVVGGTVHYNS